MRIAYLAQDRPEIQFSSKEAASCMQAPTVAAWQMLKRIGRFLVGVLRIVVYYPRRTMPKIALVYTDSDHAGCKTTRKSTSSMTVMMGDHWLRSSSTT